MKDHALKAASDWAKKKPHKVKGLIRPRAISIDASTFDDYAIQDDYKPKMIDTSQPVYGSSVLKTQD